MKAMQWCSRIALVTTLFLSLGTARAQARPIPVIIEPDQKGNLSYSVDGAPLLGQKFPTQEFFEIFGRLLEEKGRSTTILVLVGKSVPVGTLNDVRAVAQKVGFLKLRFFYFSSDRRMMAEISLDQPAVPYSLDPK